MKRIIIIGLLSASISIFFSCKSSSKTQTTVPADNSQSSLDWDGIYRGVLPCADCQGIETTIYLNKDKTYLVKSKYLGKSDEVIESSGTFSWNSKGNTITLNELSKTGKPASYMVGENTLTQLDMNGNKITSDLASKYVLSKERYSILDKYWKLVELNGKPVEMNEGFAKEPHIILKSSGNQYTGNGGCNGISGSYQLGDMNKITISPGISTQMACPNIETESQFLKALFAADNFYIKGDELILNKAKMAPLARFKVAAMK